MTTHAGLLLGAYAMAPGDPAAEETFYAGIAALGVAGLELPLPLEGAPSLEPTWIARNVRPAWDLLVTCIPTVMGRLGSVPGYGLASADEAGRIRALADVARARDLALRLADEHGRRRVVAIQVHSAPGVAGGSRDALSRSLAQILSWDLAGAQVLVEHCDAAVPGHDAAKGFCSVEDEIASTLQAAGNLSLMGVKVSVRPTDADVPTRLAVARAALDQVGLARAQIRLPRTEESTAASPEADPSHTPAGRNP